MSEDRMKYVPPDGVIDIARLREDGYYPTDEQLARGPVAVFECGQEIKVAYQEAYQVGPHASVILISQP